MPPPPTPNEWAEGFLEQALNDFRVARLLHETYDAEKIGATDLTPTQRSVLPAAVAQYLQCMEKALKAMYLVEEQMTEVMSHRMLGYIFDNGPQSLKVTLRARFGKLLDKALELEKLAPTRDATATNVEYPSHDLGSQTVLSPSERITTNHLSGAKRCAWLALRTAADRLDWVQMTGKGGENT